MAVARELEKSGEAVSLLALIDAPGPGRYMVRPETQFTLEGELAFLASYVPEEMIRSLGLRPRSVRDVWELVEKNITAGEWDVPKQSLIKIVEEFGLGLARGIEGLSSRDLLYYLNLGRSLSSVRSRFQPDGMLNCTVISFSAEESKGNYSQDWQPFVAGTIEDFPIQGDHFAMLASPAIEKISEILNSRLVTEILS